MDNLEKISKGKPITARFLNRLVDAIRANRVSSDGSIVVTRSIGGTVLRLASGGLSGGGGSIPIFTQTGGIPARSTVTPGKATNVLRLRWVGETLPTSGVTETVTVYNLSSIAVGASKYGKAALVDGKYIIDVESCA